MHSQEVPMLVQEEGVSKLAIWIVAIKKIVAIIIVIVIKTIVLVNWQADTKCKNAILYSHVLVSTRN